MARGKVVPRYHFHIKKDDFVQVIAGRDRGKRGKVLRVFPQDGRILVEGIQMIKRHTRATQQRQQQAGIIEREGKIHVSNVMLICARCDRGVRIGHRVLAGDRKVRVCRRCDEVLDR